MINRHSTTNLCEDVGEKETNYLFVQMGSYAFLPADKPHNFNGFMTQHICECICGFVQGKEGQAFFHFDKCKDAAALATMISHHFPSKQIRITLIGGNNNNWWLPGAYEQRSIYLDTSGLKSAYGSTIKDSYEGQEALIFIHLLIKPNTKSPIKHEQRGFRIQNPYKHDEMSQFNGDKLFFQYDYTALDKWLNESNPEAIFFSNPNCRFIINGITDLQGYQNISAVLSSLNAAGILEQSQVTHYNCKLNSDIVTTLTGEMSVYDDEKHSKIVDHRYTYKIGKRTHFNVDFTSHEKYLPEHLRQMSFFKEKNAEETTAAVTLTLGDGKEPLDESTDNANALPMPPKN